MIGDDDDDTGGGIDSDDIYNERVEPMLVSLSNSYSEDKILLCDSRPSSCITYTFY